MWYSSTDGQYIQDGQSFTIDGVQYPPQWLNQATPEQKAEVGLEEVVATNSPENDQFYWVSTELNKASLTYVNTPKDLDTCKANQVSATNGAAYSILLPSDWMVVKAIETGSTVPANWNAWRQSIRQQAADYVTVITACTTIEQLAALPPVQWEPNPDMGQ